MKSIELKSIELKKIIKVFGATFLGMFIVISASAAMTDKAIDERLAPVGTVCVEGDDCGSAAASASSGPKSGEEIYNASCAGCHGTGALGAPKLGDSAVWTSRLAQGEDSLLKNALSGLNAMPPRGTCASCSDDEISATIKYILENSK